MWNDISVQTLCTKTHSPEAVKPVVHLLLLWCCKSFVLVFVVAVSSLLKWSDRSHYKFSKCFCSVSFLICYASRAVRGAQSFPQSVLIVPPLIHPFYFTLLFPKWPPTPAMTLFPKLSRASTVIGAARGKSTLTSLINWISWPLLSKWRGYGPVGFSFVCVDLHTHTKFSR